MLLFLFLALPIALARPTPDSPVKVQLSSGAGRTNEQAVAKYSGLSKRSLSLQDAGEVMYFGNGTVGSKSKGTFQFLFDTGSSDVYVPGKQCPSDQCSGERYGENGVNLNQSLNLGYGSGQVVGDMWKDTVTVNGLSADNQVFVAAATDSLLQDSGANGIIGLAWPQNSKTKSATFFQNLVLQKKVKTPEFGIYYGSDRNSMASKPKTNSELTLGGRDPSKYTGDVVEVPVVNKFYWTVNLPSVQVNDKSIDDIAGHAAIDTGTQSIVAPLKATVEIFKDIPGSFSADKAADIKQGQYMNYQIPCNTEQKYMPQLVFGGKKMQIDREDFIQGFTAAKAGLNTTEDGVCFTNFIGSDFPGPEGVKNLWIIGDAFLRSWYTIYSYKGKGGVATVSFAKAVHDAPVSAIETVISAMESIFPKKYKTLVPRWSSGSQMLDGAGA